MKKKRNIEVRQSNIHARGVYATEDIPKGQKIIPYRGRRLTRAQGLRSQSEYLYELNNRFYVLGQNIARYINHSCDPNCESDVEDGEIWISSTRRIKKGEELAYNYGFSLDECFDYPCSCGTKKCVGYILDDGDWSKLKKKLKKQSVK